MPHVAALQILLALAVGCVTSLALAKAHARCHVPVRQRSNKPRV